MLIERVFRHAGQVNMLGFVCANICLLFRLPYSQVAAANVDVSFLFRATKGEMCMFGHIYFRVGVFCAGGGAEALGVTYLPLESRRSVFSQFCARPDRYTCTTHIIIHQFKHVSNIVIRSKHLHSSIRAAVSDSALK